jgi:polyhydroxyalkanoate synthesis regulator phasin
MPAKQKNKANEGDNGTKKKTVINIQMSLNDMLSFGTNLLKSGLSLKQSINTMIDKKMDEMVQKGKYTKEEAVQAGDKMKRDLNEAVDRFTGRMSDGIRNTLNRLNIATLDDIQSLEKQLDTLIKEINALGESKPESKGRASANKASKPSASRSKTTGKPSSRSRTSQTPGQKKTQSKKAAS